MKITVNYPTSETHTSIIPASGIFNPWHKEGAKPRTIVMSTPVNREVKVYVRQTERAIKELFMNADDYCMEQTGTTPQQYQARHKQAWND